MNDRDRSDENDAHNLLPPSLEKNLPPLYATEKIPVREKTVYAKFFAPNTCWTWFVLEGSWNEDHEDFIFFGLVHGFAKEYGYFTLSELESVVNPHYRVERDLSFQPATLPNYTDHLLDRFRYKE
jgi:hypothetical protein